ncbi:MULTISPECIES: lysylphosphatidylglycerol synthase transmembrane domain-containing protein [unclassified Desulfurobacterium]|uniref:lysylphosphatidylglycerol synthase transmembrane domain-containing protein n=1 Tax=Desulfurobacterium sp. TC5-1 TaxID=1158318 RepID=UPI0003B42AA2|nr:lysylphosphatidylglycerol synthase transmembrane domain-containing protein [Desulfurobacterium sp. TC5-1]
MRKSNLVISLLILVIFGYILYRYDVFSQISSMLKDLSYRDIAFSLFIYVFVYIFRALRLKLYIEEIPLSEMASVIGVHTFFNNVMPFRSGETSFPLILKKLYGIDMTRSSVVLFGARVFDLLSLSILFLFSLFSVSFSDKRLIFFPILAVALVGIALFVAYKFLHFFKERIPFFDKLIIASAVLFRVDKLMQMFFFSICIWILKFTAFMFILNAAHLGLGFFKTIFVSTFAEFTTILPIHSIGGFGTFEAGMVGGFSLIGMNAKKALPYAVYFHTLILCMSGFTALSGWLYLSFKSSK